MPANLPGQFVNTPPPTPPPLPLTITSTPSKETQAAVKLWNSEKDQSPAERFQQVVKVMLDHPEVVDWAVDSIQKVVKTN